MKTFNNLSIKIRLALVFLIPFVGMLYFAGINLAGPGVPVSAAILTVVSLVLATLVIRDIAVKCCKLRDTLDAVESSADLTLRAEAQSSDELGSTAAAFNRMMDKIAAMVHDFADSTAELNASASHLSQVAEQSNRGIQQQQHDTDEVAAAVAEMAAKVEEVARNTEQAAKAAQQAREETQNGALVATEAMCAIEAVFAEMDKASGSIDLLAHQPEE